MKKILKMLVPLSLIVACFLTGYQWVTKSDEVVYNVTTERFIHEEPETVISRIEQQEEGIYYFGFSSCPWCVELLPILDESLEQNGKQAYVVNTRGERFTENLRERLNRFYQTHQVGELSVPFLVVISEDGDIETHVGTVVGHDAHASKMTAAQEEELTNLLNQLISDDCDCSN